MNALVRFDGYDIIPFLLNRLIDLFVFYAISAIFQPGGPSYQSLKFFKIPF